MVVVATIFSIATIVAGIILMRRVREIARRNHSN